MVWFVWTLHWNTKVVGLILRHLVSLISSASKWLAATSSSRILGSICTPIAYFPGLHHNSICARTWLVNEQLITNDGCPIAQPKLTNLPSAKRMTFLPFFNVNQSTLHQFHSQNVQYYKQWHHFS